MQQICSRYAAIFIKLLAGSSIGSILAKYSIIEESGEKEEEDELLDFKKHSIFIDVLKNYLDFLLNIANFEAFL